jgi:hypothetical protein
MEKSLDQGRNIDRARDKDWRADLPWHSYLKRAAIKALLWGPNELFRRSVDWDRRPAILGDAASVCPALNLVEQNFAVCRQNIAMRFATSKPPRDTMKLIPGSAGSRTLMRCGAGAYSSWNAP